MSPHASYSRNTRVPHEGRALLVVLEEWTRVVWWGPDEDVDRVATVAGQVLTWATADACRRDARKAGWPFEPPEPGGDDPTQEALDCRQAQAWLRRPGEPLDPVAALGLWNLQWDLVASYNGAYPPLTAAQARCHRKLTVANVPWLAGVDTYRPRWTAAELRCLRAALNTAVHTVRTALNPEPRT